jgi:hypothetical protein
MKWLVSKKDLKNEVSAEFEKQKEELNTEVRRTLKDKENELNILLNNIHSLAFQAQLTLTGMQNFKAEMTKNIDSLSNTPNFLPIEHLLAPAYIETAYAMAKAEAMRIYSLQGIQTSINSLSPYHFGYNEQKIPQEQTLTMQSDCAIFPYGIVNTDNDLSELRWFNGTKVEFISDWLVKEVSNYKSKTAIYCGQLENYAFRGNQTFTIQCRSSQNKPEFDAWLKAFVVVPYPNYYLAKVIQ